MGAPFGRVFKIHDFFLHDFIGFIVGKWHVIMGYPVRVGRSKSMIFFLHGFEDILIL